MQYRQANEPHGMYRTHVPHTLAHRLFVPSRCMHDTCAGEVHDAGEPDFLQRRAQEHAAHHAATQQPSAAVGPTLAAATPRPEAAQAAGRPLVVVVNPGAEVCRGGLAAPSNPGRGLVQRRGKAT